MESETSHTHMVSTASNCPLLSFKDDKPTLVMTHGDILSRVERARVRVYLGELLDALEHADKNLPFLSKRKFIISKVVGIAIRRRTMLKFMILLALPFLLALALNCIRIYDRGQNVAHEAQHKTPIFQPPSRLLYNLTRKDQPMRARGISKWPKRAQHICRRPKSFSLNEIPIHGDMPNLEPEYVPKGEPSIDSHIARRLWYDEGKEAEAEPRLDWRTIQRLWYVE